MFVIFDLDGTLALNEHRQHFLKQEPKDWDGFYAACVDDVPNKPLIQTLNTLVKQRHTVAIWSGRSEAVQRQTTQWLFRNRIRREIPLRMRPVTDFTPDDKLKEHWLSLGPQPDLVFDDRQKVVDMWRRHGIVCCQVAPGDF